MPTELIIFLAIPVMILLISRYFWPHKITYKEMGIQLGVVALFVTITYSMGISSLSSDTEILNGYILSKDRVHDEYEEPYSCPPCSTDKDGFETCSTCYETHYTVDWLAKSTVSNINFKSLDTTSRSVYNTPNPRTYVNCKIGEPASVEHSYDNWVKAVPDNLFSSISVDPTYISKLPAYPRVYGHYKINRVINIDSKITNIEVHLLNDRISEYLKTLGRKKQVNVIVVLTEIDDPSFKYSIEANWLGGNKNDVIIVMGLDDHTITWVDSITFALNYGNENFQVNMRDRLLALKYYDYQRISKVTEQTIEEYFDRVEMKTFEDFKSDIEPPTWALVLMFIFSVFGSLGLSWFFYREDF